MANNTTTTTTTTTVPAAFDSSIESVTGAAGINCLLLVIFLTSFDLLVHIPRMRRFLLPRFQPGDTLPGFPLGWVRQVWNDRGAPNGMNPDALVFVRFCELGFKFSVGGSILDLVLIPMYFSGSGDAPGFNVFSLSNLEEGSSRFWGVVVAAYILTGFILHQMLTEWRNFVILRRDHFMRSCRGNNGQELSQARHSVIVESVPPEARSHEAVSKFFEGLFGPGSVHSCMLQQDTTQLYLHIDMQKATSCCGCFSRAAPVLDRVQHGVDRVVDGADGLLRRDFQAQPMIATRDPEAATGGSPNIPGMGHVMELGRGVRQLAVGVVQIGQEVIVGHAASSTAFVTFNKATHCAAAEQMLLLHGPFWQASSAPEPRDLIWRNVSKPITQTRFRTMVSQGLLGFGVLWWSVPVAFVQTFANVSSLQKQFPGLVEFLEKSTTVYAFVTAYLPAMALIGLQALLPILFEIMARKYEGHKTKSEVQIRVLNRCFAYQLASLYVTVLSGSVIQAFEQILDHPADILQIISDSLPKVAVYFVTFVLARVGTSLPLLLLRPTAFLFPDVVQVCYFGAELANVALVLVLGLTYSFIAPAILPACALFFGIASIMYRWLFAHVYEAEFDSGGMMWYDLFMCVIVGLFMGTLSLVAICVIKATWMQTSFLLPLPVLVLMFGSHCSWKIGAQSRLVALRDAVLVDEGEGPPPLFSEVAYSDPVLNAYYSCATPLQQEQSSSSSAATSVAPVGSDMKS